MNMEAKQALLAWYRANRRDLPFRKNKDPYRIWISEIMAQQTRIEAMLGHYERFMEAWPGVEQLARADEGELMKCWQGLGYYSRARNLKKAAIFCMEHYGGRLPQTRAELMKLPGIGEYTAGAIASIAWKERVSAIDGNVIRVASRYYWLEDDFSQPARKKALDRRIQAILPEEEDMPDFTQALMELGAMVCLPKSAACPDCPLEPWCAGAKKEDPTLLPLRKKKRPRKIEEKTVLVQAAFHEGQWCLHLQKRPDKGLLAGLYEFGWLEKASPKQAIVLEPYRHIFSHVEWKMEGVLVESAWDESFLSLQAIEEKAAVPSALMPFFEQSVRLLAPCSDGQSTPFAKMEKPGEQPGKMQENRPEWNWRQKQKG